MPKQDSAALISNFFEAYLQALQAAGENTPTGLSINEICTQATTLTKKQAYKITFTDLSKLFKPLYQLLRDNENEAIRLAIQKLGASLFALLLLYLENDKRQQALLYYAFRYETLNSFILEVANGLNAVPSILVNDESSISHLDEDLLRFLTTLALKYINEAKGRPYNTNAPNHNADFAVDLLKYLGALIVGTALLCIFIEFAVGGTGLVISIGALSLAIEHIIGGMLITGASCFAASAGVHYVYELSLENKEDSQNNNNLLNIKP
ncbi:MAG: hypothetical protein WC748_02060 [Legionellales bacterium]|jgi:hypothetical protein